MNFGKSQVYGIRVTTKESNGCARILGSNTTSFPIKYLGVPVGAKMSLKRHWQPIIDRIHSRLSAWKAKSLSFSDQLTLVKAVLGNLSIYFFSLFKAPSLIIEFLEKIRCFLWDGNDEKSKIAWVAWKTVLGPKEKGVLEVGSLLSLNLALLSKWIWRFKTDPNTLWCQVVCGIHNCVKKPIYSLGKKTCLATWYNSV